MTLDYNSLLVALGVSASCLAIILIGSWFSRSPEPFLMSGSAGLMLVVAGIFVYGGYVSQPSRLSGLATFVIFSIGFSVIWAAGNQFRLGRFSWLRCFLGAAFCIVATVPAMLLGLDGLAFIGENLAISILLFATAREYWLKRDEAPRPLHGISALYLLTSFSFLLCAAALIAGGKLVLGHAPDSWAEDVSIAVCIAGMTGIGALSLALHQWRQAGRHRVEAMTDPLTGLLNRRALFDLYGQRRFSGSMAVIVFDIDRFKSVNDQHGHAAGDSMLKLFAGVLMTGLRQTDAAGRLGGEEFAIVLDNVLPGKAEQIAERVRASFAQSELRIDDRMLKCTVSAGVAFGSAEGTGFDGVLNSADKALYTAKRDGRNRVEIAAHLRSVPPESSRTAS